MTYEFKHKETAYSGTLEALSIADWIAPVGWTDFLAREAVVNSYIDVLLKGTLDAAIQNSDYTDLTKDQIFYLHEAIRLQTWLTEYILLHNGGEKTNWNAHYWDDIPFKKRAKLLWITKKEVDEVVPHCITTLGYLGHLQSSESRFTIFTSSIFNTHRVAAHRLWLVYHMAWQRVLRDFKIGAPDAKTKTISSKAKTRTV